MPFILSSDALRLLNYLKSVAPNVNPTALKGFPTYSEIHAVLRLTLEGINLGTSLDKQGMRELAHWTRDNGFPAITGFIISSETKRPGDGFFKFYGKDPDADLDWWLEEVKRAKEFQWPHVASCDAAPPQPQNQHNDLRKNARTVAELAVPESRFFLKSEWGPLSDMWPALSFSKRSVADYLNAEYNPQRDYIVYAGTGNPERTKEAQYRKRLLSVLITEPGKIIPTEDLVPWESWQNALNEHDKIWPHSFGVKAAWSISGLPSANVLTPQAYRSLGVRRNWGGIVEILGSERDALLTLEIKWVELPNRDVVHAASSDRDQLRNIKADPSLNAALTRLAMLIQARLGGPRSVRRETPGRSLPVGTNLVTLLDRKWREQRGLCALCNQPVRLDTQKKLLQISPDRKDSKNPSYGDDNLQITHLACNLAKNDSTTEDFEEWLSIACGESSAGE